MGELGDHLIVEYIDIPDMWPINAIAISTWGASKGEWDIPQDQGICGKPFLISMMIVLSLAFVS